MPLINTFAKCKLFDTYKGLPVETGITDVNFISMAYDDELTNSEDPEETEDDVKEEEDDLDLPDDDDAEEDDDELSAKNLGAQGFGIDDEEEAGTY